MSARLGLFALILLSVGLNAAAQLLLRAAMRGGLPTGAPPLAMLLDIALRPGIVAGIACYGFSLIMWIVVLSRVGGLVRLPVPRPGVRVRRAGVGAPAGRNLHPAQADGNADHRHWRGGDGGRRGEVGSAFARAGATVVNGGSPKPSRVT